MLEILIFCHTFDLNNQQNRPSSREPKSMLVFGFNTLTPTIGYKVKSHLTDNQPFNCTTFVTSMLS